jgi:hypothetical protein
MFRGSGADPMAGIHISGEYIAPPPAVLTAFVCPALSAV